MNAEQMTACIRFGKSRPPDLMAVFPSLDGIRQLGPNALTSPIAMGTMATPDHKAGVLELRPATRIQTPKPTMNAEIA